MICPDCKVPMFKKDTWLEYENDTYKCPQCGIEIEDEDGLEEEE